MASKKRQRLLKVIGLVLFAVLAVVAVGVSAAAINKGEASRSDVKYTATPAPQKPGLPTALWVGDSYTEGTGAGDPSRGYSAVVSRNLGYVPASDAQGGTGFVNDGKKNVATNVTLAERLGKFSISPKLIVVDAGRNDGIADFPTVVAPAITSYLDTVKAKWPEAKIVLVVPYYIEGKGRFRAFMNFYAEEAARIGAVVVDPMEEGWLDGQDTAALTFTDGIHPNLPGHKLLAERFTARLQELGMSAIAS